jgi:hypothetical protein
MGYGTSFTTEIYLSRKVFNSDSELDDNIKEIESLININKKIILALAVSTPKDVLSFNNEGDFNEHPLDIIIHRTDKIFESLDEYYLELSRLYILRQYLEENPDVQISKLSDLN